MFALDKSSACEQKWNLWCPLNNYPSAYRRGIINKPWKAIKVLKEQNHPTELMCPRWYSQTSGSPLQLPQGINLKISSKSLSLFRMATFLSLALDIVCVCGYKKYKTFSEITFIFIFLPSRLFFHHHAALLCAHCGLLFSLLLFFFYIPPSLGRVLSSFCSDAEALQVTQITRKI